MAGGSRGRGGRGFVASFCEYLPPYFPLLRIDILVEERCEARERIISLESERPEVRIVTVPSGYRTNNGTRFKARANHYAHERRVATGEATDDVWVLHMDDDSAIGEDTAQSVARFITAQRGAGDRALHLGQGVLTCPPPA